MYTCTVPNCDRPTISATEGDNIKPCPRRSGEPGCPACMCEAHA